LRYRQIHLDFHTSEHIPNVGAAFDPETFVATLKAAHVDSITVFAKCHTAGRITRPKWALLIRTSPERTSSATWCAR
jgi:hypothetical protein